MLVFRRFVVRQHERGLLFRDGDFSRLLMPGRYYLFDPLLRLSLETFDLHHPEFQHRLMDYFLAEQAELVAEHFLPVFTGEQQLALVRKHGQLVGVLGPGTRLLYWKGPVPVQVERVELAAGDAVPLELARWLSERDASTPYLHPQQALLYQVVPDHHLGLLVEDGQVIRTLNPGPHAFWRPGRRLSVELVDTRIQTLEVSGQEILSRDKVSLRINLSATYRFTDVLRVRANLPRAEEFLYRELQFGLRAAVGTRSLDQLLESKHDIDQGVFEHMQQRTRDLGILVETVGVKDMILPGEMKALLFQVVEAEKLAQANIIRRREETAATRSLLNTAKVMEENPTALRLKELETLEKLTEKVGALNVYGGLEGLLKDLVKLRD